MNDFQPLGETQSHPETGPKLEEISDPKEYLDRLLTSKTYQAELDHYNSKHIIPAGLRQEIEASATRQQELQRTIDELQIYLFLKHDDIKSIVDEFRAFDKVKFKFDPRQYSIETKNAIQKYLGHIEDSNKRDLAEMDKSEIATMDSLRRNYHNEAAEKLTTELMDRGLLPKPLVDMPAPIPFGRALISEFAYSKLGVKRS